MPSKTSRWLAAVALVVAGTVVIGSPADAKPRKFQNCARLNAVYPHGVGRPGAVDSVRPGNVRVTAFKRNAAVYQVNRARLDRDKDGIACEKH